MRPFILTIIFILASFAAAIAEPAFDAGLAAYQNGKWDEAIEHWQSITARGETSGELEFNLGNAFFRRGDVPRAILHYERARKLLPNDKDIQQNLVLSNRGTIDQIPPALRLGVWNYFDKFRDAASPQSLVSLMLILNLLLVVAFGLKLFGKLGYQAIFKQIAVASAIGLCATAFWYGWRSAAVAEEHAIVIAEKSDVYSSPAETSTQLFSLHEGTKVKLGEALAEWVAIELPDGRKGWMPKQDAEQI